MKRLLISTSQKGGVGKTFVTSVIIDFCQHAGLSSVVYDLDPRNNSGITRFVPGAVAIRPHIQEELEEIILNVADANHPATIHLLDLPGSAFDYVEPLIASVAPRLTKMGVEIHVLLHINRDEATRQSAVDWIKSIHQSAKFTLVNHFKDGEFVLSDSELGKGLIEIAEGRVVEVPRIATRPMDFVRKEGFLLSEAVREASFLDRIELSEVAEKIWKSWSPHFEAIAGVPMPEIPEDIRRESPVSPVTSKAVTKIISLAAKSSGSRRTPQNKAD